MGFKAINRAQKINAELDSMVQNGQRSASTAQVELNRSMLFAAWMYQSYLDNTGDVDAEDIPPVRDVFTSVRQGIDAIAAKMAEVQGIYDADPQVMQANLDAFIAANGLADALSNYGSRFD